MKRLDKAARRARRLIRKGGLNKRRRNQLKEILAIQLRANPTKAEAVLKPLLGALGFGHCIVLFGFIPDFVHEEKRVVVEVDGSIHRLQRVKDSDAAKAECFNRNGYTLLRFTNERVMKETASVLAEIKRYL